MPLEELARHDGFEVTLADSGEGGGHRSPVTVSMLQGYDVIVGQRLSKHEGLEVWRKARGPFSRLVYELDDDVWSVNAENFLAFSHHQREDVRDAITHGAEIADLITVTTPHLAEVMTRYTGNPDVAVLPNCVPGWLLDLPREPRARPSAGWQGGASHGADIGLVTEATRRFLKRFPGWDLRLTGTDYRPSFRAPEGRASYTHWHPVNDDPAAYYSALDFDIGLSPLLDNEFNSSKSGIRVIEYMARGIVPIASDVPAYRDVIHHGVDGFLVRRDHEWLRYMSGLAADDGLRLRMSEAARETVRQHHLIENGWQDWAAAYSRLFTRVP
jgi:glycosyltransferase involved in cell wall biosynthesis